MRASHTTGLRSVEKPHRTRIDTRTGAPPPVFFFSPSQDFFPFSNSQRHRTRKMRVRVHPDIEHRLRKTKGTTTRITAHPPLFAANATYAAEHPKSREMGVFQFFLGKKKGKATFLKGRLYLRHRGHLSRAAPRWRDGILTDRSS
jgi:hypothetical protein